MNSEHLALIKKAYIALLMTPHDSTRVTNQSVMCELRDCIAKEEGLSSQEVQETYEYKAAALEVYVNAGLV